eukprot:2844637-Amphidinium_carterae.1
MHYPVRTASLAASRMPSSLSTAVLYPLALQLVTWHDILWLVTGGLRYPLVVQAYMVVAILPRILAAYPYPFVLVPMTTSFTASPAASQVSMATTADVRNPFAFEDQEPIDGSPLSGTRGGILTVRTLRTQELEDDMPDFDAEDDLEM